MNACIIAVGSEMLTPFRVDTNSLAVTERLNAVGFDVRMKVVAGDDVNELAGVFARAAASYDLVICTGGLGPTADDVTREAASLAFEMPLDVDEAIVDGIRARFEKRGMNMPAINARQGMVPRGAEVIQNAFGTAPGLWIDRGRVKIALLPGPPREMTPMLEGIVHERLAPVSGGRGLFRRVVKITGRPESDVDAVAQPIYGQWTNAAVPISTTILAVMGQIELHLTATANSRQDADAALDAAVGELRAGLGRSIYSVDGRPLEAVVGHMLRERRWTVAAAESCTGGLLMSRLTSVSGSSAYVDRGFVCYSNAAKMEVLGVPAGLIEAHGAVSEPVARAMADGARAKAGNDVGIGVTGIAGPDGGTPEKPVGTVAIAVVARDQASVRTFQFIGGREMVNFQSTQSAMNMLRILMEPK
ncbi:MAG TPA: competence/damage-inducible protein A [Vicinamibacterales bacterium]|jgi:nicotinamide-nucleotide amidase|nr:competence/damage-inducible protein A [Vicinamibacterales bacterium]